MPSYSSVCCESFHLQVLHRDLKPNNLLVNKNCDLKICDFGLARGVDDSVSQQLTEYVVTRWYGCTAVLFAMHDEVSFACLSEPIVAALPLALCRYRAPELLVENATYDQGIDIWSVGCILAECLGRKALLPGKDYLQQLRLIIETLGQPSESDLATIENPQAVEYVQALTKKPNVPFSALYPNANPLAIDLLEKMLVFNPSKRLSASDALEHEYLRALHNVNDEVRARAHPVVVLLRCCRPRRSNTAPQHGLQHNSRRGTNSGTDSGRHAVGHANRVGAAIMPRRRRCHCLAVATHAVPTAIDFLPFFSFVPPARGSPLHLSLTSLLKSKASPRTTCEA